MTAHDIAHSEHKHASVRDYIVILAILTVVTLVEVATYFIPWFRHHLRLLFSALSVLSIVKFSLVVGYYMHLRYDEAHYLRVFVVPLLIAIAMTVVVATLTALRYLL